MRLIKNLIVLSFLLLTFAAGGFYYWSQLAMDMNGEKKEFTIQPGSSVRAAARQIEAAGVPAPAWLFEALARWSGKANRLKAGSYEVESGSTPLALLDKLVRGDFSQASVAIIEGWTFAQMRKLIDMHPGLRHDTSQLSETELLRKINPELSYAEGMFYPDTYLFAKGSSDLQVYQQAYAMQMKKLDEAWQARANGLPYKNKQEALIMASIIEKETGQQAERSLIAAVFVNRLKTGMLLQTDPTVIYGMGAKYQGKIYKKDLLTDTPYNTYTRPGLPPSPIALPGLASITAALNPANSDALYFVARGDGTSHFSTNLSEHNRAVNQYQR
ncbi:endolytic transglycosylase MltG [Undibacterium rugosum]|uniref:Endolytic murein transglycosylase n=1 Tax=Undibacterium rugosum TaxID=2762291 RepID=A0A923I957_9BURK|nr:endolytic transglycosylase MltG [Undibacterium rugosum]MBC3935848.1 endolytic transglycosylase MltG [Undibacterium rugosum]MBR7779370.1 endolytic transglycosylase MltG [Undibacterium rugosum]